MVHWQNAFLTVRFEEFSLGYKSVAHRNAHKSFLKCLVYLFHRHYGHMDDLERIAPDPVLMHFPKLLTVKRKTISLPTWSWSETDIERLVLNAESLQWNKGLSILRSHRRGCNTTLAGRSHWIDVGTPSAPQDTSDSEPVLLQFFLRRNGKLEPAQVGLLIWAGLY